MTDFPKLEYSVRAVRRAGEALKGDLVWSEERSDEIKEIFQIANSWRDSHLYPMGKLRFEMMGKLRTHNLNGLTAARLKFRGLEAAQSIFDGRRIEVQVRTRLQHSWATAVEAVGTFRKEDMKGGFGDSDWLRLFKLMSAELALAEKCPEPPESPPIKDRRWEIRALNQKLNALGMLENLRQAVRFTDIYSPPPMMGAPKYYLIKYDNEKREVEVQPYFRALDGSESYDKAEQADNFEGSNRFNTVLVESFAVEGLKEAYPNYFGDVQLFAKNLQHVVHGSDAREYSMPPRIVEPPTHFKDADMSWLRKTGKRRWRT